MKRSIQDKLLKCLLLTLPLFSELQCSEMAVWGANANVKLMVKSKAPMPDPEIDPEHPFAVLDKLPNTCTVVNPAMEADGVPFSLSDAIFFALENQISLQLSSLNIEAQKGTLRASRGPFDYVISNAGTPFAFAYINRRHLLQYPKKTNLSNEDTIAGMGVTKKLRTGAVLTARGTVDKFNTDTLKPPAVPTKNVGSLTFVVQQPLMKGFLNGAQWMAERAAENQLYATYYDDFQAISLAIYNTTNAYWAAVGAQNALEVQMMSIRRITDLASSVNKLIENDLLARSSFYQMSQQESNQQLALLAASRQVFATVQALRLAMGDISVTDMRDIKLNLTDDFAITKIDQDKFQSQFNQYFDYALKFNYNIQASTLRQTVAAYLLKGADNDCLPQLDVVGQLTQQNFQTGNKAKELFSPLDMKKPESDWSLGINFSVPLYNDGALGVYEQRRAAFSQSMLNTQLLTEQVLQNLRIALSDQLNIAARLVEADQNVEIAQKVFHNSEKQFKAGISTLFDLLSYENSLTSAILARTALRTSYMQNIALIRFLTASTFAQGDCGSCSEDGSCIEILDVTTLPEFDLAVSDRPKGAGKIQEFLQRRRKEWKAR